MRKRYGKQISSKFICPQCGAILLLPRFDGRLRSSGHKKDLWCYVCDKTIKFIETRNEYKTLDGYIW